HGDDVGTLSNLVLDIIRDESHGQSEASWRYVYWSETRGAPAPSVRDTACDERPRRCPGYYTELSMAAPLTVSNCRVTMASMRHGGEVPAPWTRSAVAAPTVLARAQAPRARRWRGLRARSRRA